MIEAIYFLLGWESLTFHRNENFNPLQNCVMSIYTKHHSHNVRTSQEGHRGCYEHVNAWYNES